MSNRNDRQARADLRLQRAAARLQAAQAAYDNQPAHQIPLGQPILLGHHCQRRHERDLQRLNTAMSNLAAAGRDLDDAQRRAAAAGLSVHVDDDDAVAALTDKIAAAETEHAAYLAHNKNTRKQRPCAITDCPACQKLDRCNDDTTRPVPSFTLSNSRARINRLRDQLTQAEARAQAVGADDEVLATGEGWQLLHAVSDARVRFVFDARPAPDTRALLKRNGFRWAPTVGAWQRLDNANGLAVAKRVGEQL